MIEGTDIQKALAMLMRESGIEVVAYEAAEGADKPCCSITVFPSESTRAGEFIQEDTFSAELDYYPSVETYEELLKTAVRLKNIILHTLLKIEDRSLETEAVKLSVSGSVLVLNMDYTIEQLYEAKPEEYEPAETLNFKFL